MGDATHDTRAKGDDLYMQSCDNSSTKPVTVDIFQATNCHTFLRLNLKVQFWSNLLEVKKKFYFSATILFSEMSFLILLDRHRAGRSLEVMIGLLLYHLS